MRTRLVVIGVVAGAMAVVGSALVTAQLEMKPGPGWWYLTWPVYAEVMVVSVVFWVAIGRLFIRKSSGALAGIVAGLLSPLIGGLAVNPIVFIVILQKTVWPFACVGLATGLIVWWVARVRVGPAG